MKWFFKATLFLLAAILTLPSRAQSFEILDVTSAQSTLPLPQVPSPEQFKGWRVNSQYGTEESSLSSLLPVTLKCQDQNLFPANPDQTTKKYHLAWYGSYGKGARVRGGVQSSYRDICQVWSRARDPKQQSCLSFKTVNYVILSDLYRDRCGHLYRGFFAKMYMSDEDNMGTLVALGKTFYEDPNSVFAGTPYVETYVGGTYSVPVENFLFLTSIFNSDLQAVESSLKKAKKAGQIMNPQTLLFNNCSP
jgi:hypothetical protein